MDEDEAFERDTKLAITLSLLTQYDHDRVANKSTDKSSSVYNLDSETHSDSDFGSDLVLLEDEDSEFTAPEQPVHSRVKQLKPPLSDSDSTDLELTSCIPSPKFPKIDDILVEVLSDESLSCEAAAKSRNMSPLQPSTMNMASLRPSSISTIRPPKRVWSHIDNDTLPSPKPCKRLCPSIDSRRSSTDSQRSGPLTPTVTAPGRRSRRSQSNSSLLEQVEELSRAPCLTRRQSREISLLCGRGDGRRKLYQSLDPSIFDAEINEDINDSGSFEEVDLLPELRRELEERLEPVALDPYNYDERVEFSDSELPDLNLSYESEAEEEASFEDCPTTSRHRTSAASPSARSSRSHSDMTPLFDRPHFQPSLIHAHCITKKLKLKSTKMESSDSSDDVRCNSSVSVSSVSSPCPSTSSSASTFRIDSSKLVFTAEQRSKFFDICSKVQVKLQRCDNLLQREIVPRTTVDISVESSDDSLANRSHEVHDTSNIVSSSDQGESDCSESDYECDDDRPTDDSTEGRTIRATTHNVPTPVVKPVDHPYSNLRESLRLGHSHYAYTSWHSPEDDSIPTSNSEGDDHHMGRSVSMMDTHTVDMLEGCDVDEEAYQLRFLMLCQRYLTPRVRPSRGLVHMIFLVLLDGCSPVVAWRAYNLLAYLLAFHPSVQPDIEWTTIEAIVDSLKLPLAIQNIELSEIFAPALALQYIVSLLETDVLNRASDLDKSHTSQSRRIMKSKAFHWLSTDRGFRQLCQVIDWTIASLGYGQEAPIATGVQSTSLRFRSRQGSKLSAAQIPKVLPLFQRMLTLSLCVSRRQDQTVQRVATELVRGYMRTVSLFSRQRLLDTTGNPLLKFELTQRVLEDYYKTTSSTDLGSLGPSYTMGSSLTLDHLFAKFSQYEPPQTNLTPPLTPSGPDEEPRLDPGKFSAQSVEELSFLMWHLVSSFIAVTKQSSGARERQSFDKVGSHVDKLRDTYLSFTASLTPKTELYLMMMRSVASLAS